LVNRSRFFLIEQQQQQQQQQRQHLFLLLLPTLVRFFGFGNILRISRLGFGKAHGLRKC
jgi:hypothetical protein